MSSYSVEDPAKIQGRDEVYPEQRNLGALRLQHALDAIKPTNGAILLLGCGAGRYARAIHRAFPDRQVIGGDLSLTALSEAKTAGGGPSYLALNAEYLPFLDESFGAVVFLDLLEHVPDPDLMLRECARVLRSDGKLHYFVPLEDEPGTLYRLFKGNRPVPIHRWKRDHVGHIQRFNSGDVLRRTWNAGLPVERTCYSFHLIGQAHDILDYWQRDRVSGTPGKIPAPWVSRITRVASIATWRLMYLEDRLHQGPALASGIHVTARKADPAR